MMAGCPGHDAAKQAQPWHHQHQFHRWDKIRWNTVWFIRASHLNQYVLFGFIHPLNLSPVVLWLVHAIFLFGEQCFSSCSSVVSHWVLCSPDDRLMNINISQSEKGLSCLEVTLGTCVTSQLYTFCCWSESLLVEHFSGGNRGLDLSELWIVESNSFEMFCKRFSLMSNINSFSEVLRSPLFLTWFTSTNMIRLWEIPVLWIKQVSYWHLIYYTDWKHLCTDGL